MGKTGAGIVRWFALIAAGFRLFEALSYAQYSPNGWDALATVHVLGGKLSPYPIFVVFPEAGEPREIDIPMVINLKVGGRGRTLYGLMSGRSGIQKIDLSTLDIETVNGSQSISPIRDYAPLSNHDDFVVAGYNASSKDCGLYLLSGRTGVKRTTRERIPCPTGLNGLSPSADMTTVIITCAEDRRSHVRIFDLKGGTDREMIGYEHATWSPDGKWIAAFDGRRIHLLNPVTLRPIRSLGKGFAETLSWSPDSKYLLVGWPFCGAYFFALSSVDVNTGKRSEIKSSHCRAQGQGYWYIDPKVYESLRNK